MKVKDFIKDTIWIPGSDYNSKRKPAVSVLLPTFRRGKSGLFRKAVNSVLDQTLEDIELIIIDDASTDGTAGQIAEFMKRDGRVSCLRHPYNVGLPAISEYEAYLRARADYIAFAFDDDFFYEDALEKLLEASEENPGKVCFGNVIWRRKSPDGTGEQIINLGGPLSSYNLTSGNCISNNAVLLARDVIEDVGFYDPHILLTRLCDWDLWIRVGSRYLMHYVNIDVGEVTGPETTDSLGNTYTLTLQATNEWMRSERPLSIADMPEFDVFSTNETMSAATQMAIDDLKRTHLSPRPHFKEANAFDTPANYTDKSIFVLTSHYDASTTLYFDFLPQSIRNSVRVVHTLGGYSMAEIAHASCIIVVRNLAFHEPWIAAAKKLKIPLYYFLDDNLPELVSKESMTFDGEEAFNLQELRATLKDFAGVLLSTQALLDYFAANLLHEKLYFYPVCYAQTAPKLPDFKKSGLTVASLGGGHRHKGLVDYVLPAFQRLATSDCPVHLVVGGVREADEKALRKIAELNEDIELTCFPFEIDWTRAILQIGAYLPDLLIHAPSVTVNNEYKTLNSALCAYVTDSVLIVPDDKPFDAPEFDQAAYLVNPPDEPRAWLTALQDIIKNRSDWAHRKQTNAAFCRTHFSGEQNVIVLQTLLKSAAATTSTIVESRLKQFYMDRAYIHAGQVVNTNSLRKSLQELSILRERMKPFRRVKHALRRRDLWPDVSPTFEKVRQYITTNRIRGAFSYLEISPSISDVAYVDYQMPLKKGRLKKMTCAFASDGFHDGIVGVEFVNPDGTVLFQTYLDLNPLNLDLPVSFDLNETEIPEKKNWTVRLFTRSKWPIYIYEFAEYSWFGLQRRRVAPFASIEYVSSEDKKDSDLGKSVSRSGKKAAAVELTSASREGARSSP